jgi:hypothetical protein
MNRRKGTGKGRHMAALLLWAAIGYAMACGAIYGFLVVGSM